MTWCRLSRSHIDLSMVLMHILRIQMYVFNNLTTSAFYNSIYCKPGSSTYNLRLVAFFLFRCLPLLLSDLWRTQNIMLMFKALMSTTKIDSSRFPSALMAFLLAKTLHTRPLIFGRNVIFIILMYYFLSCFISHFGGYGTPQEVMVVGS